MQFKIVILGAGMGGLTAARYLDETLKASNVKDIGKKN